MIRFALALLALTGAAMAEEPMGAEAFEARVTGRTIQWGDKGLIFGEEQYLPGRRVVWAVEGSDCKLGHWWEETPGLICFGYDDGGPPACWRFFDRGQTMAAQSAEDKAGFLWSEVGNSDQPLFCPGPMIGV